MKKMIRVLLVSTLFALAALPAFAQPANDNFANAWTLTGLSVVTNGNSGQFFSGIPNATKEAGEPNHGGFNGGRSVWFNWTAPVTGNATVDTVDSSFNTLLGVYTGNAVNALTTIASNNDTATNNRSGVQFAATQGTLYRIAVDGRNNNGGGASSGAYVLRAQMVVLVSLTAPTASSIYPVGGAIPLAATAAIPGTVSRVDFYRNGVLIGTDATAPYTSSDASAPLGTNNYTAVAVDAANASYQSPAIAVRVVNPGVVLTAPADSATFLNLNPITLTAAAVLATGTMTNVEFFVDAVKVGEDATAPFTLNWSAVTPGAHRLTATGRDNSGNTYNSPPILIAVAQNLIARGSVWKYLDNGTDQGTGWTAPLFDDALWAAGPAELGYGDGDEATTVSFGPDSQNVYPTTYFRRAFNFTGVASYTNLVMNVKRDDGAVVYLNGVEAVRFNMNAGPVNYLTLAPNATDDGADFFPATLPATLLVEGLNVIAVEIHQTTASSTDISFELDLAAVPSLIRNQPPVANLTSPTNLSSYLAPASILLTATATDADGTITNVSFFANGVKLGEDITAPYQFNWLTPTQGWHTLYVMATDDQGGTGSSPGAFVSIYDAVGTPRIQIFSPIEGATFDGPTNLALAAGTTSPLAMTNVEFYANGALVGRVPYAPPTNLVVATATWTNATFGTNSLRAVSQDTTGRRGTSAPVSFFITTPPLNTNPPVIATVNPAPGTTLGGLTTVQVTFSERVFHVDAADFRVNGVPATQVTGSGSNYTFTVTPPGSGLVTITWTAGHGIEDFGYPSALPFNENGPGASWIYNLTDLTAPTVIAQNPAANAIVTNLTQITVTFSETVTGVDAADLLINGTPALGLAGGGAGYTFSFAQPAAGAVNITWTGGHAITDVSSSLNAFNATGAGATWNYTLDDRTVLVQSNASWLFIKGLAEASSPIDAWRQLGFNDASWSNAPAPFYYGDPYNSVANPGTLLSDMQGGAYSSIYLRKTFTLGNAAAATNLFLNALSDDGFIAWINGVEVARFNMAGGDIPYNGAALTAVNEPNNSGVPYVLYTLNNASSYLVDGVNVLTVHAFNNQPATSSDFGFNAQLYTYLADPSLVAPRLASVQPEAGDRFFLTNITVRFTEGVSGVNAGDLLVNGVAATGLSSTTNTTYTFRFAQPAYGPVAITWAGAHGIVDFDAPPKPFDAAAPGSTFGYTLLNPSTPTIAAQTPSAGASVSNLTQISITFSEPVSGVNAADLLINGLAAATVSGGPQTYSFTFGQPSFGAVAISWAAAHGIADLEAPANPFDPARAGSTWAYTLLDQAPPTVAAKNPPAGATVTNLTSLTVTFTEPVAGVDAFDLLINGAAATGVSGGPTAYTFTFPQANATVLNISWLPTHGIHDLAPAPNAFNATGPGATWTYFTPDTLAPAVANIDPPAFVTVRSLAQIRVTFTEPVIGVDTNDLLINGIKARQIAGSGAGPYTFTFLPPSNGPVEVRWVAAHGITDLAAPANAFAGGEWNYILDPAANFAGKVIINEIMLHPTTELVADEWIELHNVSTNLVNLAGWSFARGVNFTFPNLAIPAGGHLVVAADTNSFKARYPGVNNVIGNWTGRLANSDENIELVTPLGEQVDQVHYATEGDWAIRARGRPARLVSRITLAGNTATVTIQGHGYGNNEQVIISGADQPEYNGRFSIGGIGTSTFTYTVPGTPASPATGTIVCRHIVDNNASGWTWLCPADGLGSTLELINPAANNNVGQNWLSSTALNGTPGAVNSVRSNNVAPFLLDVKHFPPVPRSTDPVAITARVQDELPAGVTNVTLFWRTASSSNPGAFTNTPMRDFGTNSDGLAGDGIYGAVLGAQFASIVVEYYVQATDNGGRTRTWPAAALQTNNAFAQTANALYQVDNENFGTNMAFLRLVMTEVERAEFAGIDSNSDAEMNVTLVSFEGGSYQVRYNSGLRIRGAGSRSGTPKNYRVNIPTDNRWNDLSEINLNSRYIHAQLAGSVLAQKAGLATADARLTQVRLNGVNPAPSGAPQNGGGQSGGYGTYVIIEPINGDFAANHFPNDSEGNAYRASTGNHNADFSNGGTNINYYLGRGYSKTSNQSDNDWNDLVNLTVALSTGLSDADYVAAVRTNANVQMWMRFWAVGTFFGYGETSLMNGRGDDYAMYRGVHDPRFVLLPHDFDTILGQGDTTTYYPSVVTAPIWVMINPPNPNANVPTLNRFMQHPAHAPLYFEELKRLRDTVFSSAQADPVLDQLLTGWGPNTLKIAEMKTYLATRGSNIMAQIPLNLTVASTLGISNGFLYTTAATTTLSGTANAVDTRRVRVNGNLATWSAWEARWTYSINLQPGINTVLVQSFDANDTAFASSTVDIWHDDGSVQSVSGAIAADTLWTAAAGPYQVTGNLTVNSGVTLTVQPGTTVYLSPAVDIIVANGGRLLAEGTTTARIRFSPAPGAGNWGGLTINGGPASPESRLAYVHFTGNGDTAIEVADGTAFLDHLTFGNTARQYVSLDRASFVLQDCVFPATTGSFEPVHGTGGIKAGGRGIVTRNFWGKLQGYNDAFDFTGGNRPGPILQVINNVFMGSDDDLLDFDSTDAWVEGNIFLHVHRNGSPDSASAISGGADNADTSQITAIGNLFYDVDHAANAKQGNFYTLLNNTIVHQTKVGSQDTNTAVVILADMNEQGAFTAQGLGIYLEGNIISDAENLIRHATNSLVTYTNNIIHQLTGTPWVGGGNSTNDPLFVRVPNLVETTNFTSWEQAQVLWSWFSLRSGSPASGTGPNGLDKGGVIPGGLSISGEPVGTTPLPTATLRVGPLRTGNGIPVAGFPNGSGYTHYRWRLDGGAWSAETPTTTPITLAGLGAGPHFVEAVGRLDTGSYQDDAAFGSDAVISRSRTWTVNFSGSSLRLNEILASNSGGFIHSNTTPDAIELYNAGNVALDLSGVGLSDDPFNPAKFLFPLNTTLAAGAYLTVFANNADGTPGFHLGFSLGQEGESLYLHDAAANGGVLLDSVSFGLQLPNLSIGRLASGEWALTTPTFGAANRAAATGDPRALRINEWLAIGSTLFANDFVELYNPQALPVAVGGLYLTDEPYGWPNRHAIPALSFLPGFGYQRFLADSDAAQGADHLNFNLSGEQGMIALFLANLTQVDCVAYSSQLPGVSQGRSPNGSANIVFFDTPTPGAPNPLISMTPVGNSLVINEVLAVNATLAELSGRTPDWVELYNGTTNTLDLGDLSLTDSTLLPRKFVFTPGTMIAPAAYLRVRCDDGLPASTNNTGFGLAKSGGAVYLFDKLATGGSLLNSVVYGLQTPDFSIGRVPVGSTNWVLCIPSPDTANLAVSSLGNVANLRVNEWMADAGPGADDWFEIYNPNAQPVALGGLHLTDDLNNRTKHKIAALSFLGAGTNAWQRFQAGGSGSGADYVSFSLRALGEAVGISTTNGTLINAYSFSNQVQNVSEGRFPDGNTNVVAFPGTASPGESNYRRLTTIAINEVLSHTDSPLEDAIELRNLTGAPIDVGGWWLSDDRGTLQKYQIPSPRVIPAHGFTVIYENQFTNREIAAVPFAISSRGDEVVLSTAAANVLTGFRTSVDFGAAANSVSFGRHVTTDNREEFVAMSARTFGVDDPGNVAQFRTGTGLTNVYPRVGPVVIGEIMYHPPEDGTNDNVADEFIELRNITTVPVALYDLAAPTNTWRLRDAVDFDFASGTTMAAGSTLLVVSFDPINNPGALAAFRARYNLGVATVIVGPYIGKLANDTDDLELRRPDAPNTNDVPYILVERVRYFDTAPWPALADGTGFSLQRVADASFGNDPANWVAASPTPGPVAASGDSDGDGMPDAWETTYNLDPFNALDAALDSDGDGLSNLEEYRTGTNPRDPQSGLRFTSITLGAGGTTVVLTFNAMANISYVIERTAALGTGWQVLQTIPAVGFNRVIQSSPPTTGLGGFYRLRSP